MTSQQIKHLDFDTNIYVLTKGRYYFFRWAAYPVCVHCACVRGVIDRRSLVRRTFAEFGVWLRRRSEYPAGGAQAQVTGPCMDRQGRTTALGLQQIAIPYAKRTYKVTMHDISENFV